MQMLPRSHPENLDDLTVQVALVRPGPIQGGAVHPYLERRKRLREDPSYRIPYDDPCLEPILRDTLGAIVFQDQVIQVAMALAGFSPGEAEGLRRAMSRKRSDAALRAYRERFIEGAKGRGVAEEVAVRVFEGIQGFSGFGFPKSHAAAFGLLAYQSTWLRVRYGPEFLCSLLNEQPMGFYPSDALVHEAQRRGIEVLGPDVNRSRVDCATENGESSPRPGAPAGHDLAVRIGLGYVTGMREDDAERVVRERDRGGPYRDLVDLASRSGVGRDGLVRLAWARACESMDGRRRPALWRLGVAAAAARSGDGVQLALPLGVPAPPSLREQTSWERVVGDYASVGMTLEEHPMALLRADLAESVATSTELERTRDRSPVEVAGMVVARQRPATARGVVFMLLEDELGTINVIVPPSVYERHRLVVRTASFVRVTGRLERRDGTINMVASELASLSRPDLPAANVRHIEPPVEREMGRSGEREDDGARVALSDLGAVLPAAHSFGRRGR
jgi:error-prone DNA polymerase